MGLKIHKVSETSNSFELGETLWLTAERDEVVPDGDPRAAFLLGTAGKRITVEEAQRLGLAKGAKTKAAEPEADKESKPEADKESATSSADADKPAGPELVKDLVARMGEMSDEELKALSKDKRPGVVKARKAELESRKKKASE